MESDKKINAVVTSPAKDAHQRIGKGFSLLEVKESGHSLELLQKMNIKIDYFRRSKKESNIAELKKLKVEQKKDKKREPFKQKEKKTAEYKPKKEKPVKIEEPIKKEKKIVKTPVKSTPTVPEKKVKPKSAPKPAASQEGKTALTTLSGLGPATAKKFEELGVTCAEDLKNEDPKELASLIKGVSEDRILKWKQECEELLK